MTKYRKNSRRGRGRGRGRTGRTQKRRRTQRGGWGSRDNRDIDMEIMERYLS